MRRLRTPGRLHALFVCSALAAVAPVLLGACEGPRVKLPVRDNDNDDDDDGDADDRDAAAANDAGDAIDASGENDAGSAADARDAGDAGDAGNAGDAGDAGDAGKEDDDDIVPCSVTQPCTHSILKLCGGAGLCVECLSNADCKLGVCDLLENDCE
jgi:hypothetical protein